jgi:hypothetical protein
MAGGSDALLSAILSIEVKPNAVRADQNYLIVNPKFVGSDTQNDPEMTGNA